MPLYYVTGVAGSGKSAVLNELRARGYESHGIDEDGFAGYFHNSTGQQYHGPVDLSARTPGWRREHTYKIKRDKLEELAQRRAEHPVFVAGAASNETEIIDLFDQVFALMIDEDTLKKRLIERTSNDFGKLPHEMEMVLRWQEQVDGQYRKYGYTVIDATKPLAEVVDGIVGHIN